MGSKFLRCGNDPRENSHAVALYRAPRQAASSMNRSASCHRMNTSISAPSEKSG